MKKQPCRHPHPYGLGGMGGLWRPVCGAINFNPNRSCPTYLRSDWTLPTHDPKKKPVTVWHDDSEGTEWRPAK